MPENELRALLNRVRWDPTGGGAGVTIVARVREAGANRDVVIPFADIAEVLAGGIEVAAGTFLPYHRVLAVRRGETVLWRVRRGDDDEA